MDYYWDIIYDLYWQADHWRTLQDCDFYLSDAKRVDYLYYDCGYDYWEAIRQVIEEIEEDVYGPGYFYW